MNFSLAHGFCVNVESLKFAFHLAVKEAEESKILVLMNVSGDLSVLPRLSTDSYGLVGEQTPCLVL
jgi:hypothetical protein